MISLDSFVNQRTLQIPLRARIIFFCQQTNLQFYFSVTLSCWYLPLSYRIELISGTIYYISLMVSGTLKKFGSNSCSITFLANELSLPNLK